jgi:hypothetical protein
LGPAVTSGRLLWRGLFFFFIFLLAVCILSVSTSYLRYVGTEAGCNWYLVDSNICPLSNKVEVEALEVFIFGGAP